MTFLEIINILTVVVGLLCCFNGYMIWKNQKVKFLNKNNFSRVKTNDMPVYCKKIGQSNILIGTSAVFMGIYNQYFESSIGVLIYMILLSVGFYIGIKAQNKYNCS